MRNRTGVAYLVVGWVVSAALSLVSGTAASAGEQPAYLVKDIQPGSEDRSSLGVGLLSEAVTFDGFVYFVAEDELHGSEIWRSDGTPEGTDLFLDLCPGPCTSSPSGLQVVGETLWLTAVTPLIGREIWTSDGTREGSRLVRDICPGPCDSVSSFGTQILAGPDGEVFFTAQDSHHGFELWQSDGTRDGTVQVADLLPGPGGAFPSDFTLLEGRVYFATSDTLWQTDGTAAGTVQVGLLCGGLERCSARILGTLGSSLLTGPSSEVASFRPSDPFEERNVLRAIDPATGDERRLLTGEMPLRGPAESIELGDGLFGKVHLLAAVSAEGHPGLWRSDLSPEGPVLLHAFESLPTDFVVVGQRAFFLVSSVALSPSELWVSDGTTTGTRLLAKLNLFGLSAAALSGRLVFRGSDAELGDELWVSDGTPEGTHPLVDLEPGEAGSAPRLLAVREPWLLFHIPGSAGSSDLWRTDGEDGGTVPVRQFDPPSAGSSPQELTVWKDRVVFSARRTGAPSEPWVSDGTADGTVSWSDPARPGLGAFPSGFTVFDAQLYFVGLDPATGKDALLRSGENDGAEIVPIEGEYESVGSKVAVGDRLFFLASPPGKLCCSNPCRDLFVSEAGTTTARLVRELNDEKANDLFFEDSRAGQLTAFGDRLLLLADDGEHGLEPWSSDGTSAGTALAVDLCNGACSSAVTGFHPLGDELLMGAGTSSERFPSGVFIGRGSPPRCLPPSPPLFARRLLQPFPPGLWSSDGTAGGTRRLATFTGVVRGLLELDGRVLFVTRSLDGDRLRVSDGTAEGSRLVSDLSLDGGPAWVGALAVAGDRLYLSVFNPSTGLELWTSDGTPEGTRLLLDLWPGPRGSTPYGFTSVGGRVVFAATDGTTGVEPWVTDGTPEGTHLLQDLAPGTASSAPDGFTVAGDRVYFTADDGSHGRELWALRREALAPTLPPGL